MATEATEPDERRASVNEALAVWRKMLADAKLRAIGIEPEDAEVAVGEAYDPRT